MPPFNRDFAQPVPAFPYMPPTSPPLLVRTWDAGQSAQKIDLHPPTFTSFFQARSHIARHHAATQPPSLRSLGDGGRSAILQAIPILAEQRRITVSNTDEPEKSSSRSRKAVSPRGPFGSMGDLVERNALNSGFRTPAAEYAALSLKRPASETLNTIGSRRAPSTARMTRWTGPA